MILEIGLKILGWILVVAPLSVFIVVSYSMIHGVAKDDSMVHHILNLGTTLFSVGVVLLIVLYLTDFSAKILQLFG